MKKNEKKVDFRGGVKIGQKWQKKGGGPEFLYPPNKKRVVF